MGTDLRLVRQHHAGEVENPSLAIPDNRAVNPPAIHAFALTFRHVESHASTRISFETPYERSPSATGQQTLPMPAPAPQFRIPLLRLTRLSRCSKYRRNGSFSGHASGSAHIAPSRPTSPAIQSAAWTV